MATQYTLSQRPKSTGPILLGLGLVILFVLEKAATLLSQLLCGLAGVLLQALPSVSLAVCQALGAYVVDCERLFVWLQMLASFGPLMRFFAGAV